MKPITKHFMGIDVSKPYFDLSLMKVINHQKENVLTRRFANTTAGIKAFHAWLIEQQVSFDEHGDSVFGDQPIPLSFDKQTTDNQLFYCSTIGEIR